MSNLLNEELNRMKLLAGLNESAVTSEYKSAVQAFNQAQEGDMFQVLFTNNDRRFSTDFTAMKHTTDDVLVKSGNFFVPKEDLNKSEVRDKPEGGFYSPTEMKRQYLPQDLDRNNKQITLIKAGNINTL